MLYDQTGRLLLAQILSVKNWACASNFCFCLKKVFLLSTYDTLLPKGVRPCGYGFVPAMCLQGACTSHGCVFPHLRGDDGWAVGCLFSLAIAVEHTTAGMQLQFGKACLCCPASALASSHSKNNAKGKCSSSLDTWIIKEFQDIPTSCGCCLIPIVEKPSPGFWGVSQVPGP